MVYKVLKKQNNSSECIVCGMKNDASLRAFFYECEKKTEDGTAEKVLITVVTPKQKHQSYPGRMHGGMISALLDESIGRSFQIENPDVWGVTVDLNVKFRKPVPLDEELYIESKCARTSSRSFEGEGTFMSKDGTVLAIATGKFIEIPREKIAPEMLKHENWFYVDEPLPDNIIIGEN